ncbi:MAG: AEC family transporter [Planctomycetota bacterium]
MLEGLFPTLGAALKIGALVVIGYILAKRGAFSKETQFGVSQIAVSFCLPCLIFESFMKDFDRVRGDRPDWWVFPIIFFAILAVFFGLSVLASRLFKGHPLRPEWIALTAFHNAAYLAIPLIDSIFSAPEAQAQRGTAMLYISLIIFVYNPFLWSVPVWLLGGRGKPAEPDVPKPRREVLTPPLVAIIVSLAVGLLGWLGPIREKPLFAPLVQLVEMLSKATVPLMLITLGGIIALMDHAERLPKPMLAAHLLLRLVAYPAMVLLFCLLVPSLDRMWKFLFILQFAMPPATALAVIAKRYGGREGTIGHTSLVSYIVAAATIPLWLWIFSKAVGSTAGG